MERRIQKGVSTEAEAAEVHPLKYGTHVRTARNAQPPSSIPYTLTARAKHTRHAAEAQGKNHGGDIKG